MQLIVDESLAVGFIPLNTQQQRASLPFKPGVLERKVYNNDDKTFFSVYQRLPSPCVISLHTWPIEPMLKKHDISNNIVTVLKACVKRALADVNCYCKITSICALDCVKSFLRFKKRYISMYRYAAQSNY